MEDFSSKLLEAVRSANGASKRPGHWAIMNEIAAFAPENLLKPSLVTKTNLETLVDTGLVERAHPYNDKNQLYRVIQPGAAGGSGAVKSREPDTQPRGGKPRDGQDGTYVPLIAPPVGGVTRGLANRLLM